METTVTINKNTRLRLAALQTAMKAERNGRAVSVDEAINRALDRSADLGSYITENYPVPAPRRAPMPETAVFEPGQRAVWTGMSGKFAKSVTIRRAYRGGLVILGQVPGEGPQLYDIYDHEAGMTIFAIPAGQLQEEA